MTLNAIQMRKPVELVPIQVPCALRTDAKSRSQYSIGLVKAA